MVAPAPESRYRRKVSASLPPLYLDEPNEPPLARTVGLRAPTDDPFAWLRDNPADDRDRALRQVMLDIDGIAGRFIAAMSSRLPGGSFDENDCPAWKVYPRAFTDEQIASAARWAHSREGILAFGLQPGAAAGVSRLRAHGVAVHVCTRRPADLADGAAAALADHGLTWDSFHGSSDVEKVAWCQQRGIGVMLDDKPSTIERAAAAGMTVLSLHWTYNAHLQGAAGVTLVDGWDTLASRTLAAVQLACRRARGL